MSLVPTNQSSRAVIGTRLAVINVGRRKGFLRVGGVESANMVTLIRRSNSYNRLFLENGISNCNVARLPAPAPSTSLSIKRNEA